MSNRVSKYVLGFMFISVLWEDRIKSNQHSCQIHTEYNRLSADCAKNKVTKVPQDLNTDIQVLDVSENRFYPLNENTFKRYRALIVLKMRKLSPVENSASRESGPSGSFRFTIPHHKNIFVPLENLEELDISYSQFVGNPVFVWPTSLIKLYVAGIRLKALNLENLPKLEALQVSDNELQSFPELNFDAPITWIDMVNNPFKTLQAEDLAPFCRLQYLGLKIARGGTLTLQSYYCRCMRFEKWVRDYVIEGSRWVACYKPTTEEQEQCNLTFDEETLARRRGCLAKLPNSPLWKFAIIVLVVSLICPIVYIANEIYQRYKIAKNKQTAALAASSPPTDVPESTEEKKEESDQQIPAEETEQPA